jgi:periplasmic protein TonB
MRRGRVFSFVGYLLHRLGVMTGAVALTLLLFLVLPLMQTIARPPTTDLIVQNVDTANIPPPPPPPKEEPKEKEKEEKPPELTEKAPPIDLDQIEMALNQSFSGDWMRGDFAVKINAAAAGGGDSEALFSLADLDQRPRVIYQPGPLLDSRMRSKAPGTVYVIFVVDQRGRVEDPIVQSSTDPVFERPALTAVKQWKFEPGKRNGQPVRFRMRVPITFPKG